MINRQILGIIILIGTIAIIGGLAFVTWNAEKFRKPAEEMRVAPQQPPQTTETTGEIPSRTEQSIIDYLDTKSCANVYTPPALRQDLDTISYLDKNMLGMVKVDPVSSAELSMDSVWFFPGNKVFAAASFFNVSGGASSGFYGGAFFEHIYFLGQYSFENNEVRVDYIDEATERGTVRQFFEDRKLLAKHGLADQNTPVSPDRAYSRTRKADCPWMISAFNALPPDLDPFESIDPAASITISPIGRGRKAITNREFVYLDLTCSEPRGIKDVRYTDEEGFATEPFQPFQSHITWDLKKEGVNTITYQCRDKDGDITTVSDSIVHDTTGPILSDGEPTGAEVLPAGTTSVNISLKTNEPATCRYATRDIYAYEMENKFATTGTTLHQTTVTGFMTHQVVSYFVGCVDVVGNGNENRFEVSFFVEPSVPPQLTRETSVSISQGRTWAVMRSLSGRQFVHVDEVKSVFPEKAYTFGSPAQFFFAENPLISPDKSVVALGVKGFTVLYSFSDKSFAFLGPGSPTSWSPQGTYLLAHVPGFELEDVEMFYHVETGRTAASIDNNLNQKKILGWGSDSTVEYTTEDGENYLEIRWSLNVENGETTKISETPYPLPTPQILRAYMNENIGPTGTVVIVWTTERPAKARVYWALDREGPWNKINEGSSWYSASFVVPDIPPYQEKIFYRMATFANDGREGDPSVIIEGKPTCCWSGELLNE